MKPKENYDEGKEKVKKKRKKKGRKVSLGEAENDVMLNEMKKRGKTSEKKY